MHIRFKVGDVIDGSRILAEVGRHPKQGKRWLLRCPCGGTFERNTTLLGPRPRERGLPRCADCVGLRRSGHARRPRTHGMSRSPLHKLWVSLRSRCNTPGTAGYENYGGRGVRVSAEFDDFEAFARYIRERLGGKPTPGHTLDRIDPEGDYAPGNLRWATHAEQNMNRRPPEQFVRRKPDTPPEDPVWATRLEPFLGGPKYKAAEAFDTNTKWVSRIARHHGLAFPSDMKRNLARP